MDNDRSSENATVDSDSRQWRPRFAVERIAWGRLFSLGLLAAIVVLGVMLARDGREAVVLARELAKLRGEAGYLEIHDRSKVYAVRIQTPKPNEWAWRIYLPENHTFQIYNYRGRMPDPRSGSDRVGQQRSGSGSYSGIESGEFVMRFRIEEGPDGQWITKTISSRGVGSIGQRPRSSWLADRDWEESSDIPAGEQREFAADATFDLIRLRQESAVDPNDSARRAETIALWISGGSAADR